MRGRRGARARGRQVTDAVVDQRLHGPQPAGGSTAVVAAAMAEHSAVPYVPGTHSQARCGAPPVAAPPGPRAAHGRLSAWDPDARAHDARGSQLALQDGSGHMALRVALKEKPVLPLCGCCAGRPGPGAPRLRVARELDRPARGAGSGTWWATAACTTPTCMRPRWRPPCGARTLMQTRSAARQARPGPHPLPGPFLHARRARLLARVAVIGIGSALPQQHVGTAPCTSCLACCASQVQTASLPACAGAALPSLPSKPLDLPHHRP